MTKRDAPDPEDETRIVRILVAVRDRLVTTHAGGAQSDILAYRMAGKIADLGYAVRTGNTLMAEREAILLAAFAIRAALDTAQEDK